ncbi:MAG: hypothetical protein HKL84_03970 [Acidimicrobiaceae bacterium]|nr:hypothetical protein [Acidimicrobiaceae bacterium]
MKKIGGYVPPARWLYHLHRKQVISHLSKDLPRFYDTIESTELAGHWWLWSGTLLGFVRDQQPLRWDDDVDFAIDRKDVNLLLRSLPYLKKRGYRPKRNFLDDNGNVLGMHLVYRGIIYDFFIFDDIGSQCFQFSQFGVLNGGPVRQICDIPRQELSSIEALGRNWPCSADLDLELTAIYGNWREPDPTWSYLSSPCVRVTELWYRNLDTWENIDELAQTLPTKIGNSPPDSN